MGFRLNASNSLEALAVQLALELKDQQSGVFQPYYLVTQTPGMNNWLKIHLASKFGIAANTLFLKPNDLINKAYYVLGATFKNVLSKDNLTWLLFSLLGKSSFTERFGEVSAYYSRKQPDSDLRRLALANKLADMFDQYQIYRPEMIDEWNAASVKETLNHEWQKFLWISAKIESRDNLPDKTILAAYISKALKDPVNAEKLKAKISAIHIFGLSITTEYHLKILKELAQVIDITFYILNPSPSIYWFDDKSEKQLAVWRKKGYDTTHTQIGNTLLSNWGRVIQNTFSLLFQDDALLNAYIELNPVEPTSNTLLGKIQKDVFHNSNSLEKHDFSLEDLKDESIVINSCHTLLREVEILYNYLVHLVDRRKEVLSARDIVVMVTDIDKYAPYIKAIFDNAPFEFAYSIADESFSSSDTLIHTLESLLSLDATSFKAEEVLQLLDSNYIRRRFGIKNIALIRDTVASAGIRFGMEGEPNYDTHYVSWEYGLKRIMYGICLSGDVDAKADTKQGFPIGDDFMLPIDTLEGLESYELIRFSHFASVLMQSVKERSFAREIKDWVIYIKNILNNLILESAEEADDDYNLVDEQLDKMIQAGESSAELLSFEVFSKQLLTTLSGNTRSASFAIKGITFCSLIPMRSIPFEVVAVLGMDFDKFPRKDIPSSFNLMELNRRKGDRSVKENDKHLFLETLLSARKYFYVSYIGQSAKDNKAIPPSALVDELVDYIQDGYVKNEDIRKIVINKHALHGFSQKYLQGKPGMYDYLQQIPITAQSRKEITSIQNPAKLKEPRAFDFKEISIEKLIGFLKNPIKGYYNNVLNIYYDDQQVLLKDTETFELGNLEEWKFKNELLNLNPAETEHLKQVELRQGSFPLKNMADVEIAKMELLVAPVRALFIDCVGSVLPETVAVNLKLEKTLIKGVLKEIYNKKLVSVSFSKKEDKYLLELSIKYLTARAACLDIEAWFISARNDKVYKANAISSEYACLLLENMIKMYSKGHTEFLVFYPDFNFSKKNIDKWDVQLFKKNINDYKDKLVKFKPGSKDLYMMNELNRGLYDTEDVFYRYKKEAEYLFFPVVELFSEYYQN